MIIQYTYARIRKLNKWQMVKIRFLTIGVQVTKKQGEEARLVLVVKN